MIIEKDLAFRLSGGNSTYAFHINGLGKPVSDYFGPRLDERTPLKAISKKMPFASGTSVVYDEKADPAFVLDSEKLEFSSLGKGDYGSPSIILFDEVHGYTCDFVYESHSIEDGIPALDGFPTPHGNFSTLRLILVDKATGVHVHLIYAVDDSTGTVVRSAKVINDSPIDVRLEKLSSLSLDMHMRNPELLHLSGTWAGEAKLNVEEVKPGRKLLESRMGLSSNRHNPFFMLKEKDANLLEGDCYSFNLIYSSSHGASIEKTPKGKLRIQNGIIHEGFAEILKPGDSFETPYAIASYSPDGINGAIKVNHRFVIDSIIPERFKDYERKVLVNNWEATYFKFDEGKILSLAKDAKKLGVELFVLDDGWFKNRNDDLRALGDYQPDKRKLPGGVKRLAEKVTKMGLSFGIWVEPESISEDSDLYRAHPDWAIHAEGRTPSRGRHQLLLDLSKEEVVDHVLEELTNLLSSSPISYVKWDMNRPMSDFPASSKFQVEYSKGLYRLLSGINERFPDVFFQGCASGGDRFDLGILSYFPEIWASDNTDPIARLSIQGGLSLGYPLRTMGAHIAHSPSHQTLRKTPLATRFDASCFAGFGYELSTKEMSPLERREVSDQIAYYKEHRKLLQNGNFVLLSMPGENLIDWEVVSDEGDEAFVASFRILQDNICEPSYLRCKGLDPDAFFKIESRPFNHDIRDFGGLVNQILPIHVNPDGKLIRTVARRMGMPADVENIEATGKVINSGKVSLHEEWASNGFDGNVKVRADFGSRLYHIKKIPTE